MGRSCLVVMDDDDALADASASASAGAPAFAFADAVAVAYYELEDYGIHVNFASPSGGRRLDIGRWTDAARFKDPSVKRFASDDAAKRKLSRAIALDRAKMLTGVSYHGVVFTTGLRGGNAKAEDIAQCVHKLDGVVAGFDRGVAMLSPMLKRVKVCNLQTSGSTEDPLRPAGAVEQPGQDCVRDGNIVTANGNKDSIRQAVQLIREGILNGHSGDGDGARHCPVEPPPDQHK